MTTTVPKPPAVQWRMLLWDRELQPSGGPPRQHAGPLEALNQLEGTAAARVIVEDAGIWTTYVYPALPSTGLLSRRAGIVLRSSLEQLSIVDLQSRALVIDAHGAIGIAQPGRRATTTDTRIALEDLGLGKERPSLREAAAREDLTRVVEARPRLPIVPARKLRNHGGNESWTPRLAFAPNTEVEQLADVMSFLHAAAERGGLMVKAGGSRHSWSRAAASEQVYIQPEYMSFVRPVQEGTIERGVLRPVDGMDLDNLFVIGSGTTIRDINDELWSRKKAMPLLGGYDGQTLAGVIQTGTHGSVLRGGPIAEIVQSINAVDATGRKLRLERADGPTDPAAFAGAFPGWQLRQDTDLFNASLVSVGAFGIVFSYIVRVIDAFYLREARTRMTVREMQALLRGGNIYRLVDAGPLPDWVDPDDDRRLGEPHVAGVFHLEFLVNPHSIGGENTVIVTSRAIVPAREPEPPELGLPRSQSRYLLRVLTNRKRFSRPWFTTWVTENFPRFFSIFPAVVGRIFPKEVANLLERGMLEMVDKSYEGRSYNVFNIGDGANSIPALSAEPSVPLRNDLYLHALDVILERAAHFAEKGMMHTGPLSMRFVAGSSAMLADPEAVCRFEVIFTAHTRHAALLMRDYEDALYERFGGDVRPHWGQINRLDKKTRDRLSQMYPRLEEWKRLRAEFDPDGVFLNDWQREIFL